MTSRAVGTGILVNRADTSKDTSSSSLPMQTVLRYSLKHFAVLDKRRGNPCIPFDDLGQELGSLVGSRPTG